MGFLFNKFSCSVHLLFMSGMHTHIHNQETFYGHVDQTFDRRSKLGHV